MATTQAEGEALANYLTNRVNGEAARWRHPLTVRFEWVGGALSGTVAGDDGETPEQVAALLGGLMRRVGYDAPVTADEHGRYAVGAAVAVAVSPATATLEPEGTQQFAATVSNTADDAVTWSVVGDGSIDAEGLYTASDEAGEATVVATSNADATATGEAAVTVEASGPMVLFVDDFEDGTTDAWDSVSATAPSVAGVSASDPLIGTYSLQLVGTVGKQARASVDLPAPVAAGVVSVRFRLRVDDVVPGNPNYVVSLFTENDDDAAMLQFADTMAAELYVSAQDYSGNPITASSIPLPAVGQECTLEMIYDTSGEEPVASLYLDGVLGASYTDTAPGPSQIGAVVGVLFFGLGQIAGASGLTIDDVSVADGFQGI